MKILAPLMVVACILLLLTGGRWLLQAQTGNTTTICVQHSNHIFDGWIIATLDQNGKEFARQYINDGQHEVKLRLPPEANVKGFTVALRSETQRLLFGVSNQNMWRSQNNTTEIILRTQPDGSVLLYPSSRFDLATIADKKLAGHK